MFIFSSRGRRNFKKEEKVNSIKIQSCLTTNVNLLVLCIANPPSFNAILTVLCLLATTLRILEQSLNLTPVVMQIPFPYLEATNGMCVELVWNVLGSKACSYSLCSPLDFRFSRLLSYYQGPRKQIKRNISLEWWVFTVNNSIKFSRIMGKKRVRKPSIQR